MLPRIELPRIELPRIDSNRILQWRGPRTDVDPSSQPMVITDTEIDATGAPHPATTVFLIGRECPFRCLMCDLWKNTLRDPQPVGHLTTQLESVLPEIAHRKTIKLYNASNFFDPNAVPTSELSAIARLVHDFEMVVVENHPKLLSDMILEFAGQIRGQLQVAMGLETADESILAWLNKKMSVADYERACRWLRDHDLSVRTFLLLPAPSVPPATMLAHTMNSVRHALNSGSEVTSLIPLRAGNGVMDWMVENDLVHLPSLEVAEQTFRAALALPRAKRQRIYLDLWGLPTEVEDHGSGSGSGYEIHHRLQQLNLNQG